MQSSEPEECRNKIRLFLLGTIILTIAITCISLGGSFGKIIGASFGLFFPLALLTSVCGIMLTEVKAKWILIPWLSLVIFLAYAYVTTDSVSWNERIGAVARDGWISRATGRGATSHHGGVDHWITETHTRSLASSEQLSHQFEEHWFLWACAIALTCSLAEKAIYSAFTRFQRLQPILKRFY